MGDIIKKEIDVGNGATLKLTLKIMDENDEPEIDEMTVEELRAYQQELEDKIDQLDAIEPEDEESDEYDDWADQHEELEDLLDEVEDRLDELCAD